MGTRAATTRTDTLPEFLQSRAVGAVIAEALDNHNVAGETASGAVTGMIAAAAREIRDFHGISEPANTGTGATVREIRDDGYSPDGWDRTDEAAQ